MEVSYYTPSVPFEVISKQSFADAILEKLNPGDVNVASYVATQLFSFIKSHEFHEVLAHNYDFLKKRNEINSITDPLERAPRYLEFGNNCLCVLGIPASLYTKTPPIDPEAVEYLGIRFYGQALVDWHTSASYVVEPDEGVIRTIADQFSGVVKAISSTIQPEKRPVSELEITVQDELIISRNANKNVE